MRSERSPQLPPPRTRPDRRPPGNPAELADLATVEGPFEWARWMLPAEPRLLDREAFSERYRALAARPEVETWTPPDAVLQLARREAARRRDDDGDSPSPSIRAAIEGAEDPLGLPPYLFLGDGPIRVIILASPHADEPLGVATALAFVEALLRPEAAGFRARLSVAVAPLANPAGYAANEPWFAAANALEALEPGREFKIRMMSVARIRALPEPRPGNLELADSIETMLATYLRYRHRSTPERDVEFGYATPGAETIGARPDPACPEADFLPECRCHAAFIDEAARRWGGHIDLILPLHSMGMAAGAFALVRPGGPGYEAARDAVVAGVNESAAAAALADDPPHYSGLREPAEGKAGADADAFYEPFRYAAALTGLGLHDDQRHGAKGFWRLGPGFNTTPTAEAMRAWFRGRGAAVTIRANSMQWAGARARRAAVPEIPVFQCRELSGRGARVASSGGVAGESAETRSGAPTLGDVLQARAEAAAHAAAALKDASEPRALQLRESLLEQAGAWRGELDRARAAGTAGDPAEPGAHARARVEGVTKQARAAAALAPALDDGEAAMKPFRAGARELLETLDVRPVPLKHQMLLQLTLLLAGLRGLDDA